MVLDDNTRKLLHCYVDGELSAEKCLEVESMIKASPECLQTVRQIQSLKSAIPTALQTEPPPDLQKRLNQALTQAQNAQASEKIIKARSWQDSKLLALAASLVLLVLIWPQTESSAPTFLEQPVEKSLIKLAKAHQAFVASGRPQNESQDLVQVANTINRQMQIDLQPETLKVTQATLKGFCNCLIPFARDGKRLAYDMNGTLISLYILRDYNAANTKQLKEQFTPQRLYLTGSCGDYQVVQWQQGSFTFVLFGKTSNQQLVALMDEFTY